jgi:hypothetical protein
MEKKRVYIFLQDVNKKFCTAKQSSDGSYLISKSSSPIPISFNPKNLVDTEIEFGTNYEYFFLNRSISYPLDFIKDGAAILREIYYKGKGKEERCYLTIIELNPSNGTYELSYKGRIDLSEKNDDPKSGVFTVPIIDESAWGLLSQNDNVVYSIDCSNNEKAVAVLFDGITLLNRYTYQSVEAPVTSSPNPSPYVSLPISLVNQDGDSYGIVSKSQASQYFETLDDLIESNSNMFQTIAPINNVPIKGSYQFTCTKQYFPNLGIELFFYTSKNKKEQVFILPQGTQINSGSKYSCEFDFEIDLEIGEKLYFVAFLTGGVDSHMTNIPFTITPTITNIYISTITRQTSEIRYGLRAINLLKEVVSRATGGLYTINSSFLSENNNDIVFSGDSLRGIESSKIYTSFKDAFKNFKNIYFLGLKSVNGNLYIEKVTDIHKNLKSEIIIDLGECIDFRMVTANDFYFNEIKVGSPKVDYRHPSGRLEFNSENTFSIDSLSSNKVLDIVSVFRLGCFDAQFIIMDYDSNNTTDNSGDKVNYVVKISNSVGESGANVSNFENVNISSSPLQPIIRFPKNNDTIRYQKPNVSGVGIVGSTVNIYVDGVLDGSAVVGVDTRFSYNIDTELSSYEEGVHTGIHLIEATFTDLSAPKSSVSVFIDVSVYQVQTIEKPFKNEYLYNNKPLLRGFAPRAQNINVYLDDVFIGSTVANNSCRFFFEMPVIPNGTHTIRINNEDECIVNVNSSTLIPIITFIDGHDLSDIIVNNKPLIKGVATPGTSVDVWLNYIKYKKLNDGVNVIADSNGNWEFQVFDIFYIDPLSGSPVVMSPIQNGANTISTSLEIDSIRILKTGYLLSRPNYSSITGVTDNTVFNTEYSPARILENHYPLLSSVMSKRFGESIFFQTADKNGNLRTVLNGKEYQENDDIAYSSLGSPFAILEYAIIKTKSYSTFAKTLYAFNQGGLIKARFRGNDIYMLPIGTMKMSSILSDVQEWKLLLSSVNSYQTLLNLYKNGLTINLMKNSIYHSDANFLHFVQYNFSQPAKYNSKNIYQDWFSNRNDAWSTNPLYTQKCQTSEVIRDQVVSNGISNLILRMYRCSDAKLIDTIMYEPVSPAPIPSPDIVLEAVIDFSNYPEDKYFFVQCLSVPSEPGVIITNQSSTTSTIFKAGFGGNPSEGDKIVFSFYIDGETTPTLVEYEVPNGVTELEDVIDSIVALIDDVPRLSAVKEDFLGDLGITVETSDNLYNLSAFVVATGSEESILNIAISERVETKANWENSILIESSNSINSVGAFYSTGFKSIIRVEGLIKKLQPEISTIIASEENGNKELLYSKLIKKRVIRFGTGYGLPDYLYLKIANALTLDNLFIDGEKYTLAEDEKIEPSEDVDGHPLYYYNVNLNLSENVSGAVFAGAEDANNESVVIVVDATAFGLPTGSLININIEKE